MCSCSAQRAASWHPHRIIVDIMVRGVQQQQQQQQLPIYIGQRTEVQRRDIVGHAGDASCLCVPTARRAQLETLGSRSDSDRVLACVRSLWVVVSDHALQPLLTVEAVPLARDHRDGGVAALWGWSGLVIVSGLDSLPLFLPSLSPEQAIVYVDLVKWEEGRRGER